MRGGPDGMLACNSTASCVSRSAQPHTFKPVEGSVMSFGEVAAKQSAMFGAPPPIDAPNARSSAKMAGNPQFVSAPARRLARVR